MRSTSDVSPHSEPPQEGDAQGEGCGELRVRLAAASHQLCRRVPLKVLARGHSRSGRFRHYLGVAQLVARVLWEHQVGGSIPSTETI